MSRVMRLVLPAGDLPEFATVYKPTGDKAYKLRSSIQIFGEQPMTIHANPDVRFLLDDSGNVSSIASRAEVSVKGDAATLSVFLRKLLEKEHPR